MNRRVGAAPEPDGHLVAESSGPVDLSVVVAFRNAAQHLADQLDGLAAQEYRGHWEVVLVDNGSTDGSRAVAATYADRLNIALVEAPREPCVAYARNAGAQHARSDRLVFLDADDQVAPGYVQGIADALREHELVTGRIDSEPLNAAWVRNVHGEDDPHGPQPVLDFLPAAEAGLGVRRSLFDAVGGFPEEYRYSDEIALSWNAQLRGTPLHYVPEAVLRYRHRPTLRGVYSQARAWGEELPLLYRRFRGAGMPGKRLRASIADWLRLLALLVRARGKEDLGVLAAHAGYRVGQLRGSLRHRTLFL